MPVLGLKRGELALLHAGPPCQPFSQIGKQGGLDDPRGSLVEIDVLAAKALGLPWTNSKPSNASNSPSCANTKPKPTTTPTAASPFTPSKGLLGVGLPRKAVKGNTSFTLTTPEGTKEGIALGVGGRRRPAVGHHHPPDHGRHAHGWPDRAPDGVHCAL